MMPTTVNMRKAASWPFHVFDCHIRNHSAPTVRKATSHISRLIVRAMICCALGLIECGGRCARGARQANGSPPAEKHRDRFPRDGCDVEDGVHSRGINRAPHAVIVGEGGIHHQDVADELVVGVVVGDVAEDDQRIEESYGENERCFGGAEGHGFSRMVKVWK